MTISGLADMLLKKEEHMSLDLSSFGKAISSARKALGLSQKELAAKIRKEDGEAITPQYLNDIEHDRRSPQSDHLVREFARVLKIEKDPLYAVIGMLSEHDRRLVRSATPGRIEEAFVAFRKKLSG
jgi:transcriptional regulator with XRE-family HTH domain